MYWPLAGATGEGDREKQVKGHVEGRRWTSEDLKGGQGGQGRGVGKEGQVGSRPDHEATTRQLGFIPRALGSQ